MFPGVFIQKIKEGGADTLLIERLAIPDGPFIMGVVLIDEIQRHGSNFQSLMSG